MPSTTLKRRWTEEGMRGKAPKKQKKVKRQKAYHSSSEEEAEDDAGDFKPVDLLDSDEDAPAPVKPAARLAARPVPKPALKKTKQLPPPEEDAELDAGSEDDIDQDADVQAEASSASDSESDVSDVSETSTNAPHKKKKRNDPDAFATSISKILNTKLTTTKRSDPVLSRSKTAQDASKALADSRLESKAKRALLNEKKAALDKGRVKDVLGLDNEDTSTALIVEEEKRLKKTAQRGVIKLFNAVRAAQVKADKAEREAKQQGVIGIGKREEKVTEMSKQGFLDMIAGGGKKKKEGSVEI